MKKNYKIPLDQECMEKVYLAMRRIQSLETQHATMQEVSTANV